MSSLSATQSDGYYLPPEYFESGAYRKQSKNQYAATSSASKGVGGRKEKTGHNQWLKNGVVRFELPEKAICLGCRKSVGRGTRFNAKKVTTDKTYFSTKIYEFQMICRNCRHPWVIRTNPQDRGFAYISGVKRQAGQEKNLITDSHKILGHNATNETRKRSLDDLERAAVSKFGKNRVLTELEELERIRELNDVSASVNDAATNAAIRKSFRRDRKEKRKMAGEVTGKGWRKGMILLPSNEHDMLAANDVCYGQPEVDEKRRLSSIRKTSIFSLPKNDRKIQQRTSHYRAEDSNRMEPDKVASGTVSFAKKTDGCKNGRGSQRATSIEYVPDQISSISNPEHDSGTYIEKKKTLKLRRGKHGLLILKEKSESSVEKRAEMTDRMSRDTISSCEEASTSSRKKPLFLDMMAGYNSD